MSCEAMVGLLNIKLRFKHLEMLYVHTNAYKKHDLPFVAVHGSGLLGPKLNLDVRLRI